MFHAVLVQSALLDNGLRSVLEYGKHRPRPSERLHWAPSYSAAQPSSLQCMPRVSEPTGSWVFMCRGMGLIPAIYYTM